MEGVTSKGTLTEEGGFTSRVAGCFPLKTGNRSVEEITLKGTGRWKE